MTFDQMKKTKYRLTLMAAHNKTQTPPRVEIKVDRKDLKIMLTRYRQHFDFDARGNAVIDGSRLVPA